MIDEIMAILDKIEPLILVLLPALFGLWVKTSGKIKEKNKTIKEATLKKAQETYDKWEHEESKRVIIKIKELCNIYKDRSVADDVMYMQLENGTIATSKLCNMFLTCLAEDDRYSEIPKKIKKLQRVPYSQMSDWTEKVSQNVITTRDLSTVRNLVDENFLSETQSHMSKKVTDKDGYMIGAVVFNYKNLNFNCPSNVEEDINKFTEAQYDLLKQFQASVEAIFITYHLTRREKKRELGLSSYEESEE